MTQRDAGEAGPGPPEDSRAVGARGSATVRNGVTGLILAGGRGQRMGGRDKGLLPLDGKPLVVHVLKRLAPQVERVLVSANRNLEPYAALTGAEVVADDVPGFAGPLAGIASALQRTATPYLLTVPCDAPLLPVDLGARLHAALQASGTAMAMAHDGQRLQPLFALMRRGVLPDLLAYLAEGGRKVEDWVRRNGPRIVDFSDQTAAFVNLNTPADGAALATGPGGGRVADRVTVPLLGFAAWSGVGKTTLLRGVSPILSASGLRVGLIKHAHHGFDIDHPGKDSYELRKAGASRVLVASRQRWALMVEQHADADPSLADLVAAIGPGELDLILVEGFRHERLPKVEVHRPSLGRPLLFPDDPSIIAVAADGPVPLATALPQLDLNRPEQVADFVLSFVGV